MQKITNEEIANLKTDAKLLYKIPTSLLPTYRIIELESALDRLAELEVAVAWRGFDEVPKESDCTIKTNDGWVTIDLVFGLNQDGTVSSPCDRRFMRSHYCPARNRYLIDDEGHPAKIRDGLWMVEQLEEYGYIGWRYPVGDLS